MPDDDLTPEEREGQRDYIEATRNSSHGPIRGSEALLEGDTAPPPTAREVYEQLRWETDDGKPTWEEIAEADRQRWDYRVAQARTEAADAAAAAFEREIDPAQGATSNEVNAARNRDPDWVAAADAVEAAWGRQADAADALTRHAGQAMGADRGEVEAYADEAFPAPVARDIRAAAWDDTGGNWQESGDWFGSNRRETLAERNGWAGQEWDGSDLGPQGLEPTGAGRPAAERGA